MAHPKVHETSSLQELVQLKENEWKEAQELRNSSLQAALQEKDRQLNNEKLRFRKLKEDFGYNLKLLEERDQELQRYDALFSQFRNVNSLRDGEVSDLKIQLDDLKLKLSHEEKAKEELQRHYQQRLREHQQELNQFRLQKETEVKKEREELECFKRELQTQLRAAEEDVETQRQELMAGFDDALRKREHEFRKKADDMSNSLLASDLKVRMLTKELELLRASGDRAKDELESTETAVHDLEKQLKQKAWEITDAQSMNNAKVAELEVQIEQLKTTMNKAQERFQHKHAELDRYTKEKEQTLIASKQSHIEHERSLEEKIRVLQNQLETEQVECRRLQWAHKDAEKEHGLELHRLQGIIADLESKLDKQATESARSTVARDLELEALRQQEGKMRMEIAQHKENTDRYKKELAMAVERESYLERSKDQLEVDWQRRCEDTEREVYNKQEQLITGLSKARDEAKALAQDRQRELLQRDDLIRMLTQSRDQAVVTLQRHGLSIPAELPSKESREKLSSLSTYGGGAEDTQDLPPDEKIKVLQQKNANLREVIGQMRHDMEELSNQLASRPPSVMVRGGDNQEETSVPLTTEYVESLEKEIKELKSKNRSLRDQIDDLSQSAKPPVGYSRGATRPHGSQTQDAFIQAHIRELNVTIGALRQEKLELSAQAKKHQATVDHVQGLLNQAHEEVRQKQLTVDQLQYELTTQGRRSADQESVLKQRVTELELQLAQTRRKADEYFKSGLETNAQATSLGNQLSTLKVELASQGRGASSFNPQATVVRQLQDEIRHLRKQLTSGIDHRSKPVSLPDGRDVTQLHMKLQAAVRRISGLTQEKEQLIQMGNRLRAELAKYTGGRMSAPPGLISIEPSEPHLNRAPVHVDKPSTSKTPGEMKDHLQGQLSAVEKLQYQLTSHELQFAQRMAQQQAAEQVKVTVVSSSTESSEEGKAPQLPTEPRDLVTRDSDTKNMDPMDDHVTHQSTNQRTSSPLDGQQPLFTSSSEGQASLQEIWKMLDEEESFRSPTPHKTHPRSPRQPATSRDLVPDHIPARDSPERDVFTVKGKRTDVENKPTTQRPVLSKKAAGKAKSTPKKLRVRNYNIRDNT